ncbi:MAG: hypothetical protein JRJ00_09610, partial [Deltaproteobacteria bacterium]|nr:hypothetical protein [Deltaproteobacteria bacterium]
MQYFPSTFSELVVVVEDAPPAQLKEFATELASRLRQKPEIRHAIERFDTLFMLTHGYLLLPPAQLSRFTSVLQRLAGVNISTGLSHWDEILERGEKWLENPPPLSSGGINLKTTENSLHPLLVFLEQWYHFLESQEMPSSISWHEFIPPQGSKLFLKGGGYFSSRDGTSLFLFVKSSNSSEELEVIAPFVEKVRETAEDLRQEYTSAGIQVPTVGLTGLPVVSYEEYIALQKDIVLILCTAGVLILLL